MIRIKLINNKKMFIKVLKGDYLLIKNDSFLSKLFSIFQKKTIRKKRELLIKSTSENYSKKTNKIFYSFILKLKNNTSSGYYNIIVSCSGMIKTSYFNKLFEFSSFEELTHNNILVEKNDVVLARFLHFYFKKKGVLTFGSTLLYSTFNYVVKTFFWVFLEILKTIKYTIRNAISFKGSILKPDILIIVSQPYHYSRLESSINALIKRKKMSILVIMPYDISNDDKLNSQFINYININLFRSVKILIQTLLSIVNYWFSLNYIKKSIKKSKRGIKDLEVLEEVKNEIFINWHYSQINRQARTEALAKKIIDKFNPSLIYSIDIADPFIRIFEKVAADSDIPTYCLPYAFLHSSMQIYTYRGQARYGGINKDSSRYIKEFTGSESRVDIIGDPHYDNQILSKDFINDLKIKIGINNGDKIVSFSSFPTTSNDIGRTNAQYEKGDYEIILENLINACINQNCHILIKPHPVENNNFHKIVNKFMEKDRIHIIDNINTFEMIGISDLVVGVHSKVSFETILLDKKYLLIHWKELEDIMSLIKHDVCQVSFNSQDIEVKIKEALTGEKDEVYSTNREKYLNDMYVYPFDKSTDRLIIAIEQHISKTLPVK